MKHLAILSMVACLAFAGNAAHADLINVDFGSYSTTMSGAAMIGSTGDTWNKINSNNTTTLVNSTGSTSGVSMTLSNASFTSAYYGGANHSGFAMDSSAYGLMVDYLFTTSTATITLSGLQAGTYELYVYNSADGGGAARKTQYTVTGSSTTSLAVGPYGTTGTLMEGVNYGIMTVTVGSSGTLTMTVTTANAVGQEADACGFQLQSVPEPASAALTAIAVIGLLGFAWRKRAS